MSVEVKNLTKQYGHQRAVDGVSFSVNSGEIAGFIGPNGAGKSTTMKILTGFILNYGGDAFINGIDVRSGSLESKKIIGYLPEHNPLYLEMYVKEYLTFVAGVYGISNPASRIDEMIENLGLTKEYKKRIQSLSKGYRQRVGLASALIHDPQVLILDEPTTGLDPNQIVEIRNLIKQVGKDKTIILSTHIMQEVEAICDRIIIIDNGRIIADGNSQNVRSAVAEKKATIIVEFELPVITDSLKSIGGITAVTSLDANKYLVESPAGIDKRKDLFGWAVASGNAILGMQKMESSLEDVFRELTSK